jgi:hypothetical protein
MPVQRVSVDGVVGFRWGREGKVYTFEPGDREGEAEARAQAEAQGRAATAAQTANLTFRPPLAVRRNARRALEIRGELPPSRRAMTPTGLARARDLGNGRPVSFKVIQRMAAFFDRHEVDKRAAGWGSDSKGYQAWLGWGGDEGRAWARSILKKYAI